ncbi:hypothetical protein J6590_008459 [Homalodisca vitripennis]|nr:hypothetical protein J6590_008459 [Homalodisca vitripennis]
MVMSTSSTYCIMTNPILGFQQIPTQGYRPVSASLITLSKAPVVVNQESRNEQQR